MKKFLQISALFLITFFYGQQISAYQYIRVPEKFKDAKSNKYGLNILLGKKLKAKKFVILSETAQNSITENNDPCEVLNAEIIDVSNMFTNKVRIDFKDCNEKSVASFEGKSKIKDFEEGMKDALQDAMMKIAVSNPVKGLVAVQKESVPVTIQKEEKVRETEKVVSNKVSTPITNKAKSPTIEKAEVYTNGTLTLNKIVLSNGEFILANPNSSVPYGIFKPSSKKDTYRVQLSDGTTTLGYFEDGKILVEVPNSDGTFKNEVFSKK